MARHKLGGVRKPGPSHPHLKRTKMSIGGKSSFEKQGQMAFPSSAAAADAGPIGGGAPPPMIGGGGDGGSPAPPMMSPGGPGEGM